MKKTIVYLFLILTALIFSMGYGILIHRNKLFPYEYIKTAYNQYLIQRKGAINPWKVAIYEGTTPFDLTDPQHITNPLLSRNDVSDINADFLADPFMIFENGKYTVFFEVLNLETDQGDIGYAESTDGINWEYKKIIIDEPFHLSYPYVFKSNNDYYLIPESYQDLSVRLYKAVSFPSKWKYIGKLLSGYRYTDPSIFQHDDKWWLFVTTPTEDALNLYYSDDLLGEWRPHPMNPIVNSGEGMVRPAGKVFTYKGRLHRLGQDKNTQVFAYEIIELSEETYKERIASSEPIVAPTGKGWNARRMHHVDLHELRGRWIGVVDGSSR